MTLDTNPGIISKAVVSGDGSTVALLSTDAGGKTFVLSAGTGAVTATFPSGGQDLAITSTGTLVAVANANQLKLYSVSGGLQWVFNDDSYVRFPRFSADNSMLVCTSDLGSVDVLNTSGSKLFERDMGVLCAAAWHPGGDLILASWEGEVTRIAAGTFAQAWCTLLSPSATDMRNSLMNGDGAPVTAVTGWGNALALNYPLTPNLLSPGTAYIAHVDDDITQYDVFQPTNLTNPYTSYDASPLVDGSATAPSTPWALWDYVYSQAACGADHVHIQLDTWNTMMQVSSITLWEDPNHPESWIRNATLDYWNVSTGTWVTGPALLSNAATHTHVINPPLQTPRVRVTLPVNSPINTRLGEIVLNGSLLGCSHPDVVAGNNTCVLFDENTYPFSPEFSNGFCGGWNFQYTGAYSGAMCMEKTDTNLIYPIWSGDGPFNYMVPDWNMKITQSPQNPNEFRYLQFAWKAVDPNVTGITLELGSYSSTNSLASLYCGTWCGINSWPYPATVQLQTSATVPTSWTLVTVDLWQLFQNYSVTPPNITWIDFGSTGGTGEVEFDAIKLFKTNPTGQVYTPPTLSSFTTNNSSYTATYTSPANVIMTAVASDPNAGGSITKVEFYNGDALLGTVTSSPYSYTWVVSAAGSYALTARAYDNFGLQTNSSPVNITVSNTQVGTPYFSPPAGTYSSAQTVSIGTSTNGATIRYTMNGITPSETVGTVYSSAVNITAGSTLQAIAYSSGMADSAVASGVYAIQCAVPTFTPQPGLYQSAQLVTIGTSTSGATIRYTTDGSTPTETAGTVYSSAVNINSTTKVQAIAYKTGMADSAVACGVYVISPPPPSTGLVAWYSGLNVPAGTTTMSCWNDGTANQFTATGTATFAPSVSALNNMPAVYFNGAQTMLTANMSSVFSSSTGGMLFVLYAPNTSGGYTYITQNNAGAAGQNWDDYYGTAYLETFLNATYGRTQAYPANIPTGAALLEVESSPANGFAAWVSNTAGTGTPPAAQYWQAPTTFTLGGGGAGPDFTGWVAEVLVYNSASDTVREGVEAYIKGLYGIGSINPCAPPSFTPGPGAYATAQTVTIGTSTSGATIRYTTDGSMPSETAGTVYSSALSISADTTLNAIAYKSGLADSLVAPGVYLIQCATPTFSLAAGTYSSAQSVTISTTTGGATIRYTTNGIIPSATVGTVYSNAVTISANATLQAVCYKSSMGVSTVAIGNYYIQCAVPTFNPVSGTYIAAQTVTISTTTGGATIRYTTDGSTPGEMAGTLYSSPVILNNLCTLQAIAYETGMADSALGSSVYNIQDVALPATLQYQDGWVASPYDEWADDGYTNALITTTNTPLTLAEYGYNNRGIYWLSLDLGRPATISTVKFWNYYRDDGCETGRSFRQLSIWVSNTPAQDGTDGDTNVSVAYPNPTVSPLLLNQSNGSSALTTISVPGSPAGRYVLLRLYGTYENPDGLGTAGDFEGLNGLEVLGSYNTVAAPTFSPAPGVITSAEAVTITTATNGATIRYTTDGSTPGETHGTIYSTPVTVSGTVQLQAIAYMSGLADSQVATGVYLSTSASIANGLVAWYTGQNIPAGVYTLTSWNDSTANQFTATGEATYYPNVSALNNQPAVYFDGAQSMLTANMSSAFSSSTGGMLFVLYAPNTSGNYAYITQNNAGGASRIGITISAPPIWRLSSTPPAGVPMRIPAISPPARRCWRSNPLPPMAIKPG